jgi:hypothetical protein
MSAMSVTVDIATGPPQNYITLPQTDLAQPLPVILVRVRWSDILFFELYPPVVTRQSTASRW